MVRAVIALRVECNFKSQPKSHYGGPIACYCRVKHFPKCNNRLILQPVPANELLTSYICKITLKGSKDGELHSVLLFLWKRSH
jgi:hypothetical protein